MKKGGRSQRALENMDASEIGVPNEGVPDIKTLAGMKQTELDAPQDKQTLCISILVNGFVNSFVDFFYLTHRSSEGAIHIPDDQMEFIKTNLTNAEKAHRRGTELLISCQSDK